MVHESLESALNESEQAITRRECWGGVGGGGGGGGDYISIQLTGGNSNYRHNLPPPTQYYIFKS